MHPRLFVIATGIIPESLKQLKKYTSVAVWLDSARLSIRSSGTVYVGVQYVVIIACNV